MYSYVYSPVQCSIMLMTCLFLFLFFLCHFLFLCHIHLQLRLLPSSPLFLASFIFSHSADRCKWNERQVLLGTFFSIDSLQMKEWLKCGLQFAVGCHCFKYLSIFFVTKINFGKCVEVNLFPKEYQQTWTIV